MAENAENNVKNGGIGFAGLLTLLLIYLKLTGVISWSWWLVLLPLYLWAAILVLIFVGAALLFVLYSLLFVILFVGVLFINMFNPSKNKK